jgi:hypothetical protein
MRVRVLVAATALVALAPAAAAAPSASEVTLKATSAAAPAQGVTLGVERFFEQSSGLFRLRYSGRISARQANEYVAILHQRCGQRSSTAIGGATTGEDGWFETVPVTGLPPQSGTFRARWKNHLSDPVTLRSPVRIVLIKRPQRRYLVRVLAESNLSGRFVALQRLAGGGWTHVRRARLTSYGFAGSGGGFETTFKVRKRGLTLRILVPERTVAPCHDATASQTFVS